MSAERFLAPLTVFGLRALLLFDVVAHEPELLHLDGFAVFAKWFSAGLAAFAYLCTVLSPPGFLKASDDVKPPLPLTVVCWVVKVVAVVLAFCCRALGGDRWLQGAPIGAAAGSVEARARELQPITLGRFEEEDDEDPGEEVISPQDLESGGLDSSISRVFEMGDGFPLEASRCESSGAAALDAGTASGGAGRARSRSVQVFKGGVRSEEQLRYCKHCQIQQPLRTKHCRDCGRCVRTHDHHCPWVGTCVAEGNRVCFWWYLAAQSIELAVFSREGWMHLVRVNGWDVSAWMNKSPLLVFGLFIMSLLLMMVSILLCFHSYLAMSSLTTWETMSWHHISYLKHLRTKSGSPFSQSLRANLAIYCCPAWCLGGADHTPEFERTPEGWTVWQLGEQGFPAVLDFGPCGCGGRGALLCPCFDARAEL